jgi:predicted transcriptional regulator
MSHKLLLHPSQSLSRANSPYNFSTVKLPFVNHDSSRAVASHYCYIQHNSESSSTLTELNERCNTKTGTHLLVGAQMPVKVCKGQREKDRERETTLETKINNIWANYLQYTVGDPFI